MLSILLAVQDPQPGIARELAQARAQQIAQVHYELEMTLGADADAVRGRAVVRFTLRDAPPTSGIVLDFAGSELG